MSTRPAVQLRPVIPSDLPRFFENESDVIAVEMAAFFSRDPADRAAFDAHWARILSAPDTVIRTIVVDGEVAGNVLVYGLGQEPEVSYWLGREYWGRGIASEALAQFIEAIPDRPLLARVAKDNTGSLRVLQKSGFVITGEEKSYAGGRGKEAEEYILSLGGESNRSY